MSRRLILYFTLGYPDNDTLENIADTINTSQVEYVEFGFPSKDPVYDGPAIKKTHKRAMESYDREKSETIFKRLTEKGVRLYALVYVKDIHTDLEGFFSYLSSQGFSGVILPDLLVDFQEEAFGIIGKAHASGLEMVPFFNPSTPDSIIEKIAGKTESWVYYGLQPSTGINVPYDAGEVTRRIIEMLPDREVNFGFGIRNEDNVKELVENGAEGVAIGSVLVGYLDANDSEGLSVFLGRIRSVLNET